MSTPWPIRLYRAYRAIIRSDRFLTRRFITSAASINRRRATTCLDIGAGIAPYREAVSRQFLVPSYVTLDFVPSDAIDVVGDATALPLANGSVDLVVCFEALQHISKYHSVLDEIKRVLSDGGGVV